MESRVSGKGRENGQERVRTGRGLRKEAEERQDVGQPPKVMEVFLRYSNR